MRYRNVETLLSGCRRVRPWQSPCTAGADRSLHSVGSRLLARQGRPFAPDGAARYARRSVDSGSHPADAEGC